MREARTSRRRRAARDRPMQRPAPFDQADLQLRRAERLAGSARTRAQKQARRRFLVATLVLAALVAGVAYLVWLAFVELFGG
jgi:cell division septal protein FtsQ